MAAPAAEKPAAMDTSAMDAAMAGDPASESIAVYARLKPVGKSDTRGDVVVPKRFGKQKSVQVRTEYYYIGPTICCVYICRARSLTVSPSLFAGQPQSDSQS